MRGDGLAEVAATGPRSRIGKIGQSLGSIEIATAASAGETRGIVRTFAAWPRRCAAAVLLYGLLRGGWLDAVLAGIALGMSMLPEEFPLVLTVFMAMGAWRISLARVLTRRAAAIETLGSATVLCTDKTGTLTENRMTIVELRRDETLQPARAEMKCRAQFQTLEFGCARQRARAVRSDGTALSPLAREQAAGFVPTDLALQAGSMPTSARSPRGDARLARARRQRYLVATKGAPEAIARLCRLDCGCRATLTERPIAMAAHGLRVLGVARATPMRRDLPDVAARPSPFDFLGLVGLADPLRAASPPRSRECRSAGIRVVMITGDYPADRAGDRSARPGSTRRTCLTGGSSTQLNEAVLRQPWNRHRCLRTHHARAEAAHRQALKAHGEIVAMTGDGVNDAPSLKAAISASPWAGAAPTWRAKPRRSCCSTTISAPSCAPCGSDGASTTICARR